MAEKSLTLSFGTEVDFFVAPYSGWYRFFLDTASSGNGQPVVVITPGGDQERRGASRRAWIIEAGYLDAVAGTAALADREVVGLQTSTGTITARDLAITIAAHKVDIWLELKDRIGCNVPITSAWYLGERLPVERVAVS